MSLCNSTISTVQSWSYLHGSCFWPGHSADLITSDISVYDSYAILICIAQTSCEARKVGLFFHPVRWWCINPREKGEGMGGGLTLNGICRDLLYGFMWTHRCDGQDVGRFTGAKLSRPDEWWGLKLLTLKYTCICWPGLTLISDRVILET